MSMTEIDIKIIEIKQLFSQYNNLDKSDYLEDFVSFLYSKFEHIKKVHQYMYSQEAVESTLEVLSDIEFKLKNLYKLAS